MSVHSYLLVKQNQKHKAYLSCRAAAVICAAPEVRDSCIGNVGTHASHGISHARPMSTAVHLGGLG